MGNTMKTWGDMRKYLEEEILAECLKGRICYHCTKQGNMDGASAFEIYIDGDLIRRFSMEEVAVAACETKPEAECRDMHRFWQAYWRQKDLPPSQRNAFDDEDFSLALWEYRCLGAQDAIASDDPVVRMFAILDRRIEKCTLEKLAETVDEQPEWLKRYYDLRLEAEGIQTTR